MLPIPIRTTVIGSYPFPGWLEFATQNLDKFGKADIEEMIEDAVIAAIHDQVKAGLDVITDGEQTRLDFNLSFYGHIKGIENNESETRKFGPPAHDQRGKNNIVSALVAPNGLGVVNEFLRLKKLAPAGPVLKVSIPGPYTLSGRLLPNDKYKDRYAITEALLPIVRSELESVVAEGCTEITVDEPSMSCYAYKEDTKRFVDIFNRTIKPITGKCNLSTHLCFGNFKGHPIGYRSIKPMLPDFLELNVDEIHIEMGYVIEFGNRKIYHSGDTLWFEGMVNLLKPFAVDVALLPINGNKPERKVAGNLNGKEAVALANFIQAKYVIPCHYDMFTFNTANVNDFVKEAKRIKQPYRILKNGERFDC